MVNVNKINKYKICLYKNINFMSNNISMYFKSESWEKSYQLSTTKTADLYNLTRKSPLEMYNLCICLKKIPQKVSEVVGILNLNNQIGRIFIFKCSIMLKV